MIKHRVVGTIPLTFIFGIYKLVEQTVTEGLDLFLQTVFCHHQGEFDGGVQLLAFQETVDDTAAKTDYSSTSSIGILHIVDILGCLNAFLFNQLSMVFRYRGMSMNPLAPSVFITGRECLHLGEKALITGRNYGIQCF